MSTSKKMDSGEEIVRLLVLQLRQSAQNQAELIAELDKSGFGPSRIAELLGTTANSVQVSLSRAKKPQKAN